MDTENDTGKVNNGVDDVMEQAKKGAAAEPAGEKRSADTANALSPDNAQPKADKDAPKATTADERMADNKQVDQMSDADRRKHSIYERLKDAVAGVQEETNEVGGTFGLKARSLMDEALVELRKSF